MTELLARYRRMPRPVVLVLAAQLVASLLSVSLLVLLNLHLRALGWDDATIARVNAYRFAGPLLLALPAGLALRGRRLKPFLATAAALLPVATWAMLDAADAGRLGLVLAASSGWGIALMGLHVAVLPYLMRVCDADHRTEAFALNFAAFPLSLIACGVAVPLLRRVGFVEIPLEGFPGFIAGRTIVFDDATVLRLAALAAAAAVPLVLLAREPVPSEAPLRWVDLLHSYDWLRIARAVAPNLAVAVGAGLTIPYVNLFFNSVFDLSSAQFSMMSGATGVLVLLGSLVNPHVWRGFGYHTAITTTQSLAVLFLVGLATTEILSHLPGMLWLAAACFMLRQPLMNMSHPVASELAMSYVGDRNRELTSALTSTIWSGSWFLSAKIFEALRARHLPYWKIFLMTAALYVVGIAMYAALIRAHERERAADGAA